MKSKILFVLFISTAGFALAASGACSGHQGVSCSAGPDSDGSVICVDGWKNSSVSYASMVKCKGYSSPSSLPVYVPEQTAVPRSEPASAPMPTNVQRDETTIVKEIPRTAPTPGAKPLVTKPAATSSVIKTNTAQKVEKGPTATVHATTTVVVRSIATSTTKGTVTQTSSSTKERKLLSIFNKFKFWQR